MQLNVKCIHLQCLREYWDNQLNSSDERATSIVKLSQTERQNLATENLVCERASWLLLGTLPQILQVIRVKDFKQNESGLI